MMLTTEQIDSYRNDGYTSVPGVFSAEVVSELRRVTDEFVDLSRQVTESDGRFDLEPGHSADDPRLRRLKNPEQHHSAYDRVIRDGRVLDMMEQLLGPDVREFGGKLNMKSAGYGSPVEWHQDHAFGPLRSNDDILAVGVAIDNMTLENGCLLVVPGSHRGSIFNHYQDDIFAGAVTDPDFDPKDAVPIQLSAGDISIHHGRTLHASAQNKTPDRPRRFYLLQYCSADCWEEGVTPERIETYASQVLRGEMPAEPRYADDVPPVPRPANPQAGRGGSIYEQQTHITHSRFERA